MTLPEHTRQPLGPNQERWLKALESGNYEQGEGKLRSGNAFCCLGIGCLIAKVPGRPQSDGDWYFATNGSSWTKSYAPTALVEYLALRNQAGGGDDSREPSLIQLNDFSKPFSEIAAIIRSDPSVYFKEPR